MDAIRLPRGWTKDHILNNKSQETQYLLKPPLRVPHLPLGVDQNCRSVALKRKPVNENEPPLEPTPPKSLKLEEEPSFKSIKIEPTPPKSSKPEEKPAFKSIKIYLTDDKRVCEVCRICFCAIQDTDIFKLAQEPGEDTPRLKDMLKQVLPDLDLEIYQNSVICKKCKGLLVSSFELRTAWLATEEKLRAIVEKQKGDPEKSLMLVAGTVSKKAPRPAPEESSILKELLTKPADAGSERRRPIDECASGPLLCELCGRTLCDKRALKIHQRAHEKREEKRSETQTESMCERCGDFFDTLAKMKRHVYRKHNRQPKKNNCNVCGKAVSVHHLRRHMKTVHMDVQEYTQCHLCGKRVMKKSLYFHLKGHKQKQHRCQFCSKSFHHLKTLREHLFRHGDDELACETCGATFKHRKSMNKHMQIVHGKEGKANCESCEKVYHKESDLVKHMIREHGISKKQQESD